MGANNQELVREINKIFHNIEASHYDLSHPEILSGDLKWWQEVGAGIIKPLSNSGAPWILDIGSGTGFVANTLLKYLKEPDSFINYDLSIEMLKGSRDKLGGLHINLKKIFFINGGAETLPFKNNSFDAITLNAVIHHLGDYGILLKEIDRVLKPQGVFIVSHEQSCDFFKSSFFRITAQFYKLAGGRMQITDSTREELNRKLKNAGFTSEDLSKEEIMGLVDYHSPIEQKSILIDVNKGISPQQVLKTYFRDYQLLEFRRYSTFFYRPFLEKNRFFKQVLKTLNYILLRNNGPLFSFIIKKPF